jgi:hypothetical protein
MVAWVTPLGEGRSTLEIRGEVYNVTNAVNYAAPETRFGAPGFLTRTAAHDPRVAQVAVRVRF